MKCVSGGTVRRRKKKNETVGLIFAIIALFLIVKIISDKTFLEGIISLIGIAIFGLLLIVVVIFGYRLNRRAKIKMKLLAAGSDNPMQLTPNHHENMKLQFPFYDAMYTYVKGRMEGKTKLEHAKK